MIVLRLTLTVRCKNVNVKIEGNEKLVCTILNPISDNIDTWKMNISC